MLKYKYFTVLALICFAGCTKDPESVGPTNKYSTGTFPQSIDNLQSILAPAYGNLRSVNLFGFELMPKAVSNATHAVNSGFNGDGNWNDMANTNLSANNNFSTNAWAAFYTGVKNCNVTLSAADFFEANYAKPADKPAIDLIRGQALFLRAWYYFQLECYYGEAYIKGGAGGDKMGIPLYEALPGSVEGAQQPRSSVRKVWDFIINDLTQSATLLKGKVWAGNDRARISEWAAKGLLGKAYVFTEDWAKAKTTLLDVIQNSGKTLMPYAKYKNAFGGIEANEFNEESLWELNIDPDNKGNYGPWGNTPNATTLGGIIWAPFALGNDGTEAGANALGYGNEFVHDKNVLRFGFNLGTYTLVDNPKFDNSKAASFTNPKQIMDPVYKQKSIEARTNRTVDPRLFVNAIQPWVDSVKLDGARWWPAAKPNYLAGQMNTYGWGMRKYAELNVNLNEVQREGYNIYFLRMADIYLLYAEASKGSGDAATALEYLNKVKRRAYDYPINAPSPVDYASLTAATSAIGDPVLGNNPLYYERWAELWNEVGHWWFDVCRFRIGKSEATYFGTALNVTGPFKWEDSKSYTWPIPVEEFNSNAKIAGQQNPGY